MNRPHLPAALLLAFAATAAAAEPPRAEQVARQFLKDNGQPAEAVDTRLDATSRLSQYNEDLSQDIVLLRPNFVVDAPQAAFYLAIVRNHSADRAWCVRPKGTVRGETAEGVTVSPDNFLVPPGQYSVLMMALVAKDDAGRYDYSDAIATTFWPPDPSAPAATACRGRVPSQLDAWLADPGYRSYPDFLASRETAQEALDATRLSDEELQDVFDLEPVEDE
jgi:hypothetical protein